MTCTVFQPLEGLRRERGAPPPCNRPFLASVAALPSTQEDVEAFLNELFCSRGEKWVDHQIEWKVEGPYCRFRSLSGRAGLVELYRAYRSITDALFEVVEWARLGIENSGLDPRFGH